MVRSVAQQQAKIPNYSDSIKSNLNAESAAAFKNIYNRTKNYQELMKHDHSNLGSFTG